MVKDGNKKKKEKKRGGRKEGEINKCLGAGREIKGDGKIL